MPELPEVLTIKNDLKKEIKGKKVTQIKSHQNYALNPSKSHFKNYVLGSTIVDIDNVAKLITIKLSSNYYIATHLNMSGRLLYNNKDPYVKITLGLDNGDTLNYSSVRMFGYFEVWSEQELNIYKTRYAKTILDETFSPEDFIKAIKRKNTHIKDALLDQKLVSGIGNIYANDALFMSKIHPQTKPSSLNDSQLKLLYENLKEIINEGLLHRGSTIDRYCDIYGKPGTHQNHFRVYKRQSCINCSSPIEIIKLNGRGTFFCAMCQPKDNQARLL